MSSLTFFNVPLTRRLAQDLHRNIDCLGVTARPVTVNPIMLVMTLHALAAINLHQLRMEGLAKRKIL